MIVSGRGPRRGAAAAAAAAPGGASPVPVLARGQGRGTPRGRETTVVAGMQVAFSLVAFVSLTLTGATIDFVSCITNSQSYTNIELDMRHSNSSTRDPLRATGLAPEVAVVATTRTLAAAWMEKATMRVVEAAEDPNQINNSNREETPEDRAPSDIRSILILCYLSRNSNCSFPFRK